MRVLMWDLGVSMTQIPNKSPVSLQPSRMKTLFTPEKQMRLCYTRLPCTHLYSNSIWYVYWYFSFPLMFPSDFFSKYKRIAVLRPATSCVKDGDVGTVSARHGVTDRIFKFTLIHTSVTYQTSEFADFNAFNAKSVHLRKTPLCTLMKS